MRAKFQRPPVKKTAAKITAALFGGAACGFCNGFFGGGGGLLAVPILLWCFSLGEKKAHATAIAVMLPLTVVSLVTYHNSGAALPENAALVIVSATVGGIVGAALLKKLPAKILKQIFGAIMVFAGLKMFFG